MKRLQKLRTLKAGVNKITDIFPLASCDKMEKLQINNNSILIFESTLATLKSLRKLQNLAIFPNPCMINKSRASEKLKKELNLIKLDKAITEAKTPNPFQRVTIYSKTPTKDSKQEAVLLNNEITGLKQENSELKKELSKIYMVLSKLKESAMK